jgi:hypothetical protein
VAPDRKKKTPVASSPKEVYTFLQAVEQEEQKRKSLAK